MTTLLAESAMLCADDDSPFGVVFKKEDAANVPAAGSDSFDRVDAQTVAENKKYVALLMRLEEQMDVL